MVGRTQWKLEISFSSPAAWINKDNVHVYSGYLYKYKDMQLDICTLTRKYLQC